MTLYTIKADPRFTGTLSLACTFLRSSGARLVNAEIEGPKDDAWESNATAAATRLGMRLGVRLRGVRLLHPQGKGWRELVCFASQINRDDGGVARVLYDVADQSPKGRVSTLEKLRSLGLQPEPVVEAGDEQPEQPEQPEEQGTVQGPIPAHYSHCTIEPLAFILGALDNPIDYIRGNIIKYAARMGHKVKPGQSANDAMIDDLRKLIHYAVVGLLHLKPELGKE